MTPKTKMTVLKQLRNFLFCGMAVTGFFEEKPGCPTRSALAARQNFGRGSGRTEIARAQHGGRASKQCEHGIRIFWKRRCVAE